MGAFGDSEMAGIHDQYPKRLFSGTNRITYAIRRKAEISIHDGIHHSKGVGLINRDTNVNESCH